VQVIGYWARANVGNDVKAMLVDILAQVKGKDKRR
jgi:hypothetical protein